MKDSFKDLTYKELITKRDELTKQFRDIYFDMVVGHIDNPLQKRELRRKIARLNTIIHEYDIKIRKSQE